MKFKHWGMGVLLALCCRAAMAGAEVDAVAVEVHYQNGVKFFDRGLYDRAIREFEEIVNLDPANEEAKTYLEKAKALKERQEPAAAKKAQEEELKDLYSRAKALYAQKDFEAAGKVFDQILQERPMDEYASFYKERCEIYISRKMLKEAKIEERERLKEEKEGERQARKETQEKKRQEHQEMLKKREEITREHRESLEKKARGGAVVEPAATEVAAAAPAVEQKPDPKEEARERKLAERQKRLEEKEAARQEKLRQAEERRQQKEARRQEKIQAKQDARQEKSADARWHAVEHATQEQEWLQEKKRVEAEKEGARQARSSVRDLYVQGVEQYAGRDYEGAIRSFEGIIEAERSGQKAYTGAAQRMIQKAKKRRQSLEKKGGTS